MANINFKKQPHAYRVGKGDQNVLLCEPYKTLIGQHFRYKDPDEAATSATKIYKMFLTYLSEDDFVGADLARKHLQMGYNRARDFAKIKVAQTNDLFIGYTLLYRGPGQEQKSKAAAIFYWYWKKAEALPAYRDKKTWWKQTLG